MIQLRDGQGSNITQHTRRSIQQNTVTIDIN